MQRLVPILFAVVIVCSASASFGQDPHSAAPTAEGHYQTAVSLFGEGRYREALDEFDAAIAIAPQAVFYCNRAIVLIKLQETEQALTSLESCRDRFEGDDAEKAQIDAQVGGVAAYHRLVRITAPQVASNIARGPDVAPVDETWGLEEWGLITTGVGVALMGGALAVDLTSKSLRQEFEEEADGGDQDRYNELKASLQTRQTIFWTLTAAGSAAIISGVIMIIIPNFGDDTVTATVVPTFGQGSIGVTGILAW